MRNCPLPTIYRFPLTRFAVMFAGFMPKIHRPVTSSSTIVNSTSTSPMSPNWTATVTSFPSTFTDVVAPGGDSGGYVD